VRGVHWFTVTIARNASQKKGVPHDDTLCARRAEVSLTALNRDTLPSRAHSLKLIQCNHGAEAGP